MTVQTIEFEVMGKPQGKGRPRAARRGKHIVMYTPEKTVSYEAQVKAAANQCRDDWPVLADGPVAVTVQAVFEPPASWSKAKRQHALNGLILPTGKPDGDNVAKAVMDALNGVLWHDDAQVVTLSVSKVYGTQAMVKVRCREVCP